jgi:nucleoside diphosphate kinase
MDLAKADKTQQETFIERWDRTQELLADRERDRWKRRLDSIARLIENASTCAAIAIHNNSFLIATNKNFPKNTDDQGYKLIDAVMSFFRRIANGEKYSDQEYKEVFKTICEGAMSGLQILAYKREELGKPSFIEKVIQSRGEADLRGFRDFLSEQTEEGHYPNDIGAAFAVCLALLKDFDKTIDFIRINKDKTEDPQTVRFINAIKNYNKGTIITKDKLEGKVAKSENMHAEMRIISIMEDRLKDKKDRYENYIGISKLCCLDCHAFIYAINKTEYNNKIDTRGAHNVQHSGNWSAPFNISRNPPNLEPPAKGRGKNSNPDPFCAQVVQFYKDAYKLAEIELKTTKKRAITLGAAGSSEYPNDSQSSGDENEEIIVKSFITYLGKKREELSQLKKMNIPGINVDESIFTILNRLLKDAEMEESELNNALRAIGNKKDGTKSVLIYLGELNDEKDIKTLNIPATQALAIFCSSSFVGEEIANKFCRILQESKIIETKNSSAKENIIKENYEEQITSLSIHLSEISESTDRLNDEMQGMLNGDISGKRNLVEALFLLSSQGEISTVILEKLALVLRHNLIEVLTSEPFSTELKYKSIIKTAKEIQTSQRISQLNKLNMTNEGKDLAVFINDVMTNSPQSAKKEILDVIKNMPHPEQMKIFDTIAKYPDIAQLLLSEIIKEFPGEADSNFKMIAENKLALNQHGGLLLQQQEMQYKETLQQKAAVKRAESGGEQPTARPPEEKRHKGGPK